MRKISICFYNFVIYYIILFFIFFALLQKSDENCFNTIKGAYEKSKNPDKLFVGLVQQNCVKNCRSGVLADLTKVDVEPDEDCHARFCESDAGREHCEAGRVRALHVDEDESLGAYAARYVDRTSVV